MERLSISALAAAAQQRHAGAHTRVFITVSFSFFLFILSFFTLTMSDRGPWQARLSARSHHSTSEGGPGGAAAQRA